MITRLPGLIDVHVHLREPGLEYKEDFSSGSKAAIKGGFTFLLDMPNNPILTTTPEALQTKINLSKKSNIDIGFYFGTTGQNTEIFPEIWNNPFVFGLKIYCNLTTGNYVVRDRMLREKIVAAWNHEKPIAVHAEGDMVEEMIELAEKYDRRLHICHVARKIEVEAIRKHKSKKLSAGVTPHHLFLYDADLSKLGSFVRMKPELGTKADQESLWEGIEDKTIDVVESDHAPHTREDKAMEPPGFGVPGLETTLGLLLTKLPVKDITRLLYDNPKKLFHIPDQENTYIEVDPEKPYTIGSDGYETKCGWSPFDGWEAYGKVEKVVMKGTRCL